MNKDEFYSKLQTLLSDCGVEDTMRGYQTFISLSYKKYNSLQLDFAKKLNKQSKQQFKDIFLELKKAHKFGSYLRLCRGKN